MRIPHSRCTPQNRQGSLCQNPAMPQVQVARRMGIKQSAVKTNIDRIPENYALVGRPAPTNIDLRIRAIDDGLVEPTSDITTAEKHL